MCARSAFTPETNGLPSNSLRIATAASSAAVSPALQARAQRSAFRLAVAEMQPAKFPERASIRLASVEGKTANSFDTAAAERAKAMSPEESFNPAMRVGYDSRSRLIKIGRASCRER